MSGSTNQLDEYIERLPSPAEVRRKIAENLREAKLPRRVLKMSEQREKVEEVRSWELSPPIPISLTVSTLSSTPRPSPSTSMTRWPNSGSRLSR